MKSISRIFLLMLLLIAPLQADQQGIIVRQATVYSEASSLSERIGQLKAGSPVAIVERQGGWQEVHSDKRKMTGWVRVYQVRAGDFESTTVVEEKEDSRGFLSGLAAFSRKASGFFTQDSGATSSGTATIGVRGLSESELKSAKPDKRELQRMIKFASKPGRMSNFAGKGKLKARKVRYLPEADE
jgi:hypothetical protein